MAEETERVFMVPLGIVTHVAPRTKRAPRAIREIRRFVARHMKTDEEKVWLDGSINESVWARGIQKPPRRLRVRAVRFEDGVVEVSLPEAEATTTRARPADATPPASPPAAPAEKAPETTATE